MRKQNIFKGLALMNFIGLITLFLLYRSGSFDNYFQKNCESNLTSPNGGTPAKLTNDSIIQKLERIRKQKFSSSDSSTTIEKLSRRKDSTKKYNNPSPITEAERQRRLMYSSKSMLVVDPNLFNTDSLQSKQRVQPKKTSK